MNAKLRGHHLICLNFFRGEGYSEDFIKNIYEVLKKEELEIVPGPDDVCYRCPYLKDSKCTSSDYTDKMIMAQDREALRLLGFNAGEVVSWEMIADRLPDILIYWKTQFCTGCVYKKVCFND